MKTTESHPAPGSQLKRRLIELARAHLDVPVGDDQQDERAKRLAPLFEALSTNVFRLVVMGEVKKGKSSFINALLGQTELLPIATHVATSTVYKIIYGAAEKFTVFFLPPEDESTAEPTPVEISRDRLKEFGTEDENPGNAKQVDFIAIELPHPLLAEGIVIVDTPGVGGLFKKHRDITFRYAPQADVVFFVLDSVEAVISEDEVRFLRELQKNTQRIIFLQTKIDIAGTEQVESWKKRNLEVLAGVLQIDPQRIPYYLVGAKQKQRADKLHCAESLKESGYLDVLQYLRERLIPARDEILTRRWLPVLAPELLSAGKLVADRLNIVREAHQPLIAEYETKLAEAEREYDRWQNEVWPERFRSFQDETGRLKRDTRNQLQDDLSPESRECAASVDELRSGCQTADQVNELGDQLLAEWAARWNSEAGSILDRFRRNYAAQCENVLGRIAEDLRNVALPELTVEAVQRRVETADQVQIWREAAMTSTALGGPIGEAAKWTGLGTGIATAIGLLSNPIGWTISAAAGLGYLATRVWGAVRGYNAAKERQRDAAVVNFERALVKTGNLAVRGALRIFDGLAADLDSAARAQTDSFRATAKKEFTSRRQEIVQSRTRTATESKAAEDKLKACLAQYNELGKRYQDLKRQLDAGTAAP